MIHKTAWVLLAAVVSYGCGGAQPGGSLPVAPVGAIRDKAPMVVVPAGDFIRGSQGTRSETKVPGVDTKKKKSDSTPVRRIYLDTFRIEKIEVTNAAYGRFVAATGHSPPPFPSRPSCAHATVCACVCTHARVCTASRRDGAWTVYGRCARACVCARVCV